MILNTGNRTDIPAFYSEWFFTRVREGYALSRSPYAPGEVYRYRIHPDVVDLIAFGTKDPSPMLPRLSELAAFRQFWYVTITPYGKEIEPGVPDKERVMEAFKELSARVGAHAVGWRYDPIFLSDDYPFSFHVEAFEKMCRVLAGATHRVVISFIDLYEKTRKNFPEVREVPETDRLRIGEAFAGIAARYGMKIHTCLEGTSLSRFGIDTGGCLTRQVLEEVLGEELVVPAGTQPARAGCACLLGGDIGSYNTCRHFCRYCYANTDRAAVLRNSALHDPSSPFLIGKEQPGDHIRDARQVRYSTGQLRLF